MEFGNSLYQKSVDRYASGEDVPLEQVRKAWLNMAGVVGPPAPVYASLYQAVRETSLKRRGKRASFAETPISTGTRSKLARMKGGPFEDLRQEFPKLPGSVPVVVFAPVCVKMFWA